jgi:outer membrane receptor for ferrienterochelin and colicin
MQERFSGIFLFLRATVISCLVGFLCPVFGQTAFAQTLQADVNPKPGMIRGLVRDAETGESLAFVHILLKDLSIGTSSSSDGQFVLEGLNAGKYKLIASFLGYQDTTILDIEVQLGSTTAIQIDLRPAMLYMPEVVVTAGARSQSIKLAPASIGVITAQQIRSRQITTFDQAFDEMPGVVVTRASGSNVSALSIRGASEVAGGGIGNRVLLLIDGRPSLSPESGGALWNLVPLSSVERIEVVRGAYSALYGSSAMGGVINVVTRKAKEKAESRIHVNYGAYGAAPNSSAYNQFGDFHTMEVSHARRHGRFSWLVDGSWKSDAGHREKTAFNLWNGFAKANWEFRPGHEVQFSINSNRMQSDAPATWLSRRFAYSVAEFKKDDYQDRTEWNADLLFKGVLSDRASYSSRVYHYRNFSYFSFDDDPGNDSTNVNIGKQIVKSYSVTTRRLGNITQFDFFPGERHYLIAGWDVKRDYILGIPDIYLYGERRAVGAGFYVQDEFKLSDRVTITGGARLDIYHISGISAEANFNPKLAVRYQANSKLVLRGLLAQAFRDPPVAERFIKFEQGGGLAFQPNPNLRPEKLDLSAELGATWLLKSGSAIEIATFYNHYRNLISFQQVSQPLEPLVYQVVNLRQALMQGVELSFRHQIRPWLNANLAYTFLDARDISPERLNDALAYKVRHTLGASLHAQHKKFSLLINNRYRSRIEEVFIYPGSEPAAAFIACAKMTWQPKTGHNFYVAVNNLNNAQYEELERYRMPGRRFTTGIDFSF